jgi:hypothetical protein
MGWLARLWRHRKLEQDLGKELQFHIAERIEAFKNMGINDEEARRRVRQEFGGIEQVKEVCRDARGTRWFEDFWRDVHYTIRMWRQRPGFAVITLAMLALGSGATTIMFTVINGVLLKPLSYPEPIAVRMSFAVFLPDQLQRQISVGLKLRMDLAEIHSRP